MIFWKIHIYLPFNVKDYFMNKKAARLGMIYLDWVFLTKKSILYISQHHDNRAAAFGLKMGVPIFGSK